MKQQQARKVIGTRCGMDVRLIQGADIHQMISLGYELLGNYGGGRSEREEISPLFRRLELLRAVTALEEYAASSRSVELERDRALRLDIQLEDGQWYPAQVWLETSDEGEPGLAVRVEGSTGSRWAPIGTPLRAPQVRS